MFIIHMNIRRPRVGSLRATAPMAGRTAKGYRGSKASVDWRLLSRSTQGPLRRSEQRVRSMRPQAARQRAERGQDWRPGPEATAPGDKAAAGPRIPLYMSGKTQALKRETAPG